MNNLSDKAMDRPVDETILRLEKIHKVFEETGARIELFRDLDLEIRVGDFLAIKGASGVGKSTLLHIAGLLEHPTAGKVHFKGMDTSRLSDRKISSIRNRDIGFVFQFHHLLPDFTVWENVLMPKRISGLLQKQDEERAEFLLEKVGMQHRLQHLPSELSGGERQRVSLARALMNGPGLLLCDEPSGNLDVRNSEMLHALLLDLNRELRLAILVVTHDMGLAALARHSYMMQDGVLELEPRNDG